MPRHLVAEGRLLEPNWCQGTRELRQPRQAGRRSTCRATSHESTPKRTGEVQQGKEEAGGARGQGGEQSLQKLKLGRMAPTKTRGKRVKTRRKEGGQERGQGRRQGTQGVQKGATRGEASPGRGAEIAVCLLCVARGDVRDHLPRHVPHREYAL